MRSLSLLLAFCAACGAKTELGGGELGGNDAPSPPPVDAAEQVDDVDAPVPPPDASNNFLQQCMAKGYTAQTGLSSLYRVVTNDAEWAAARSACAADVPGATHLVVLSDATEVAFIKQREGWVGLSDLATENTFVNVTQEPNDLRPFLSGQPDNGGGTEDCVQMKEDGLDDDQCDETHTYVCECDGRADVP
jgi:hypothetical protein